MLNSFRINILLFVFLVVSNSLSGDSGTSEPPRAKAGILDLSDWSWENHKTIRLNGEWEFFWKQWIETNPSALSSKSKSIFVNAPAVWNDLNFYGETVESHGFASYRLKILLPKGSSNLALSIPDEGTAYNLFANGQLIANAGIVGNTKEFSSAKYKPQIAIPPNADRIELILHISNFQNRWGGYWYPIRFGSIEDVLKEKQIDTGISFAVCLSAAIMAIYNLVFYLFRRKDLAPLFFSIHCTLILIRALTTGERFGHLIFTNLSWELLNRLEYISIYLSAPVLYAFLYRFCPTKFWEKFGLLLTLPLYLSALAVLLLPNQLYTLGLAPIQAYCFLTVIPCWTILLIYGILKKYEGSWILFLGYLGVTICTINDILYTVGFSFINTTYLIPYGQLALIASHSILISKRFSNSLNRSEDLSHKMKTLVSSTRDIMASSSFANATQTTLGILSENIRKNQGLYIYLPETNSSLWKQYSIDTENDLRIQEIPNLLANDSLKVNLSSLSSPQVLNDRLLLPVQSNQTSFVILDLPIGSFLHSDSEMDWVQGIAYALALSIQNLLRQDREKLAIIGELSAEIAHDIGHHVLLIQKVLRNMNRNGGGNQEAGIAQAKKETEALANLSLDILEFSKKRIILDLKSVDIRDYFKGVREDLDLLFEGTGIRFSCDVSAEGEVRLDPLRIRRLILNLAKNAVDAIGGKGNFSIQVAKESGVVYIIFKDDGPGFSEEFKKVFYGSVIESRKPQGAGLGLSIVRKIALAHGGEVLLDSAPGKGSRVTVQLPA